MTAAAERRYVRQKKQSGFAWGMRMDRHGAIEDLEPDRVAALVHVLVRARTLVGEGMPFTTALLRAADEQGTLGELFHSVADMMARDMPLLQAASAFPGHFGPVLIEMTASPPAEFLRAAAGFGEAKVAFLRSSKRSQVDLLFLLGLAHCIDFGLPFVLALEAAGADSPDADVREEATQLATAVAAGVEVVSACLGSPLFSARFVRAATELGFLLGVLDVLLLAAVRVNFRAEADHHGGEVDESATTELLGLLASIGLPVEPEARLFLSQLLPTEAEAVACAAKGLQPHGPPGIGRGP